jgi:hypothetical protein
MIVSKILGRGKLLKGKVVVEELNLRQPLQGRIFGVSCTAAASLEENV